jgi:hypothetical protein
MTGSVKGSGRLRRVNDLLYGAGVRKPPMNEPAGGGTSEIGADAMEIWPLRQACIGKRESRWGGWSGGQQGVAGRIAVGDGDRTRR